MDQATVLSRELYRVVGEGNLEAVASLLEDGGDPGWRCEWDDGKNALHLASLSGATHIMGALLESGRVVVDDRDGSGRTALHLAVSAGSSEAAELLLDAGADVDAKVWDMYETPLLLGVKEGAEDAVQTLLERGAYVNCVEKTLGICNMTPLHWAAKLGLEQATTLLLYYGGDVEAVNDYQESALHLAVAEGQVATTGLLLRAKAQPNVRNMDGKTPLHVAVENGETAAAELLLNSTAVVDARDKNGETPLHTAVHHNQTPSIMLLLEHGADLAVTDARGWAPLHTAAWTGKPRNVKLLLDKGADVNAVDRKGATALHYAAQYARGQCVDILIGAGASLGQKDDEGHTAIDHAFEKGHDQLVALLTQRMKARDMTDAYVVDLLKQRQRVRDRNASLAARVLPRARPPTAPRPTGGRRGRPGPANRPVRPNTAGSAGGPLPARPARGGQRPQHAATGPARRFERPELPPLSSTQIGSLSSSLMRPPRRSPYYSAAEASAMEAKKAAAEAKVKAEMAAWARAQAEAAASSAVARADELGEQGQGTRGPGGATGPLDLQAEEEIERLRLEVEEAKRRKVLKYEKRQLEMSRELRRLRKELRERDELAKDTIGPNMMSDTMSVDSSSISQMSRKELRERHKFRRELRKLRSAHAAAVQERNDNREMAKKLTKEVKGLRNRLRSQQEILRAKNTALKAKEGELTSKRSELESAARARAMGHGGLGGRGGLGVGLSPKSFISSWLRARSHRLRNPRQPSYRPESSMTSLSTASSLRRRKRLMPRRMNPTERRREELAHVKEDMTDMLYFLVGNIDEAAASAAFERMQAEAAAKEAEYKAALEAKDEQEARINALLAELEAEEAELAAQRTELITGMTQEFLEYEDDKERGVFPDLGRSSAANPHPRSASVLDVDPDATVDPNTTLYRRRKKHAKKNKKKAGSSSVCAIM